MFYHEYFQSPMKYSIIFWLLDSYSKNVVCIKKSGNLIFGIKGCASCRNSFKAHKVLTLASTCVLEVWRFYEKLLHEYEI